jgi:hypothetical protein
MVIAFWANKKSKKRNHFFVENVLRNYCYRVQLRAVYGSRVLIIHDEVVMNDKLDSFSVWRFVAGDS